MAENNEMMMPIANVSANPLIILDPNHHKIRQVINEEELESRIDVQARPKPSGCGGASATSIMVRIAPGRPAPVREQHIQGMDLRAAGSAQVAAGGAGEQAWPPGDPGFGERCGDATEQQVAEVVAVEGAEQDEWGHGPHVHARAYGFQWRPGITAAWAHEAVKRGGDGAPAVRVGRAFASGDRGRWMFARECGSSPCASRRVESFPRQGL